MGMESGSHSISPYAAYCSQTPWTPSIHPSCCPFPGNFSGHDVSEALHKVLITFHGPLCYIHVYFCSSNETEIITTVNGTIEIKSNLSTRTVYYINKLIVICRSFTNISYIINLQLFSKDDQAFMMPSQQFE